MSGKNIFDMIHDGDDILSDDYLISDEKELDIDIKTIHERLNDISTLSMEDYIYEMADTCVSCIPCTITQPEICVLCGKTRSYHKIPQTHGFISIKSDFRCKICLCYFFEHKHSFNLNKMRDGDIEHHHYQPFSRIK
jgi:hypothetical protein